VPIVLIFSQPGFTLLEVIIAIGLLAISALAIAGALGAAVEYSGTAALARASLIEAEAVADTATRGAFYPPGWHDVGRPGPDLLPGTADDAPVVGEGSVLCQRRITPRTSDGIEWLWIEVECWTSAQGASASDSDRRPGGKLGAIVRLVAAR
jgi:prepilin-type N-terminal cleavage/methylation domain-containing protein